MPHGDPNEIKKAGDEFDTERIRVIELGLAFPCEGNHMEMEVLALPASCLHGMALCDGS